MSNNHTNIYLAALTYNLNNYFSDIEKCFQSFGNSDSNIPKSLIEKADKWSRNSTNEIEFNAKKPEPLQPITEYLTFDDCPATPAKHYFSFKPLSIEKDDIFPKEGKDGQGDHDTLWNDLKGELRKLKHINRTPTTYTESLIFLLKKYLTYIPNDNNTPYTSLFEHIKIRAAIANCLYVVEKEAESEEHALLLFCADISGIQSFIYDIASSKAARSLKGRSFYLNLLMEDIILKIISDVNKNTSIDINRGHIVYASGGKMYLLLPNLPTVKSILANIEAELIDALYKDHKMSLYICMDAIAFGYNEELKIISPEAENGGVLGKLSDLWTKLSEKTTLKKHQKYKSKLISDFDNFFEPIGEGYDTSTINGPKSCAVTGEVISNLNPKKNRLNTYDSEEGDEPIYVTETVKEQAVLGHTIRHADYHIISSFKFTDRNKSKKTLTFQGLDKAHHDFSDDSKKQAPFYEYRNWKPNPTDDLYILKRINNINFLENEFKVYQKDIPYGFSFYGGNHFPEVEELDRNNKRYKRPKEYSELAGKEAASFKRLGILRMDVDGLGGIFADKLPKANINSFAAYATLSTQLDLFFSGYLNTIREEGEADEKDGYFHWIHILYAGGDDLFVIGRWDLVIQFGERVRADFEKFVGGRKRPSISAGLSLVGGKFPIAKAADMSGEAEKEAKNFSNKNAICLLGETVSWENEFDEVKEMKDKLVELYQDNKIPMSFIQLFRKYKAIKDKHKKVERFKKAKLVKDANYTKERRDYSYRWHTAYQLGRIGKELRTLSFIDRKFIKKIQAGAFIDDRKYDIYALAARWAELEIRKSKNNS